MHLKRILNVDSGCVAQVVDLEILVLWVTCPVYYHHRKEDQGLLPQDRCASSIQAIASTAFAFSSSAATTATLVLLFLADIAMGSTMGLLVTSPSSRRVPKAVQAQVQEVQQDVPARHRSRRLQVFSLDSYLNSFSETDDGDYDGD
eukprot:4347548-Pleurochrysis_carterae.AAC.8